MQSQVGFWLFVWGLAIADAAPKFSNKNPGYQVSVDPGSADGYPDEDTYRAGSYWPMRTATVSQLLDGNDTFSSDEVFPASVPKNPTAKPRQPPPALVPFDTKQATIFVVDGVYAQPDVWKVRDTGDAAIRLTGMDKDCVRAEFTSVEDECLFDPRTCHLSDNGTSGLSLSLWINLPNNFDTQKRYILDTGATTDGQPGLSIYYTNSQTGRNFNHQITIIVSVGQHYWQAVLNGMIAPSRWTNLGLRWSSDIDSSGLVYGLQVFVNRTSTAWKRAPLPSLTPVDTSANHTRSNNRMTVGCKVDGSGATAGRLDELAVWYWRLRDDELQLLDGDLQFDHSSSMPCDRAACLPGDSRSEIPLRYLLTAIDRLFNTIINDDVTPAREGDCMVADAKTWHGDHPILCADTKMELQNAVDYKPDYKSLPLLQAMVRVLSRASTPLAPVDIEWLRLLMEKAALPRLKTELTSQRLDTSATSMYMDFVSIMSKLSTPGSYDTIWMAEQMAEQRPGIMRWNKLFDEWLKIVGSAFAYPTLDDSVFRSANYTAAAIFKLMPEQSYGDIIFPDYSRHASALSSDQTFWHTRNYTWGLIRDFVVIPQTTILSYQEHIPVLFTVRMHQSLGEYAPAFLDARVNGVGDEVFSVNSRVVSVSAAGSLINKTAWFYNRLVYTVQHKTLQDDRPFMKAAILCVRWNYNYMQNVTGAWDTANCSLVETNDTHTTCACVDSGDYAILVQNYDPPDAIADKLYEIPLALYLVSIACLVIFIVTVTVRKSLHYEMHLVHSNLAFATMLAIVFYVSTIPASRHRITCAVVSIFVHYAYIAMYTWLFLSAHYVCRAIVTGRLGSVLFIYNFIGWLVPAVVSIITLSARADYFGFGPRCFGSQYNNFMAVYIGLLLAFCCLVLPVYLVASCNIKGRRWIDKNPYDWSDVKWTLFGGMFVWILMASVWVMAVLIYLVPQPYQTYDFLFEIFNSLQGVAILLLLGFGVPSFREAFFCRRKYEDDILLAEETRRRKKVALPYFH